jgi:hypothetical protein
VVHNQITSNNGAFFLQVEGGEYLAFDVTSGGIFANAHRQSAGSFVPMLGMNGTVSIWTPYGFCSTAGDAQPIASNAPNIGGFSTSFSLIASFTEEGLNNVVGSLGLEENLLQARDVPLGPCDVEWINFIWQTTGGFILATGLLPAIASDKVAPGIAGLLRQSPRVAAALDALADAAWNNLPQLAAATFAVFAAAYGAGLLNQLLRMLLPVGKFVAPIAISYVLVKLLTWVFAAEVEVIQLTVAFGAWSYAEVQAALALNSCRIAQKPKKALNLGDVQTENLGDNPEPL